MKKYNYTVFIGRFQPLHKGHEAVIEEALRLSDCLIIGIGSAEVKDRLRNPFSYDERVAMIRARFPGKPIKTVPLRDFTYRDDKWLANVQEQVDEAMFEDGWTDMPPKIALIGCRKDNTGYFLKLFPQWDSIDVAYLHKDAPMHATDIRRQLYLEGRLVAYNNQDLSLRTREFLHNFAVGADGNGSERFKKLVEEFYWNEDFKDTWSNTPYPVTFNTTDAVVIQSGHVLLVKRGQMPGKGLWALPGGYLEKGHTLYDNAVKELREETQLGVTPTNPQGLSEFSLKAAYKGCRTFDDPHRSDRGRLITTAFLFKLQDRTSLPAVKGADDAEEAMWIPLSEVDSDIMFEDHAHILFTLLDQFA